MTGDDQFYVGPDEDPKKYRLGKRLGKGGEGEVWTADITLSGSGRGRVAVKILHDDLVGRDDGSWNRHGNMLRLVSHPGLVRVLDVFTGARMHRGGDVLPDESSRYIVMEYIGGETLSDWLTAHPDSALETRLEYLRDIAAALDAIHSGAVAQVPIAHGDVKPGNIVIRDDKSSVLVDFGLMRISDGTVVSGATAPYAAPELFNTGAPTTPEADRFAFAATVVHVVLGGPPPTGLLGPDLDRTATMLTEGRLSARRHALQREVMEALRARPDRRPDNLSEWLSGLVAGLSATEPRADYGTRSNPALPGVEKTDRTMTKPDPGAMVTSPGSPGTGTGGEPGEWSPLSSKRTLRLTLAVVATLVLVVGGTVAHRTGPRPLPPSPGGSGRSVTGCPSVTPEASYVWVDSGRSCLNGDAGGPNAPFFAALNGGTSTAGGEAVRPAPSGSGHQEETPAAEFRDILTDIQTENHAALTGRVEGGATTCGHAAAKQTPHVTVVVLGPWSSPLAGTRAVHELLGAYIAQWRANHLGQPSGCGPYIRLVAADPGPKLESWQAVIDGLRLTYADLVAVTGLALSLPETVAAARYLNGWGIPVVADLVTADGFDQTNFAEIPAKCVPRATASPNSPTRTPFESSLNRFHRIAFGNSTHIASLADALRLDGPVNATTARQITQDGYEGDPFACTNVELVQRQIRRDSGTSASDPITFTLSIQSGDSSGQLQSQISQICNNGAVQDTFYTARGLDLATFLEVLAEHCGRTITVAASSDATILLVPDPDPAGERRRQLALQAVANGKVRLLFTVASTLADLTGQSGYLNFRTAMDYAFTGASAYHPVADPQTLADTWAFNAHDAVYTVAGALHAMKVANMPFTPGRVSSELGTATVSGASQGTVTFADGGTLSLTSDKGKSRSRPTAVRLCADRNGGITINEVTTSWPLCPGETQPQTSPVRK